MLGKYIVIEGQDATGKSTQVEMLAEHFKGLGKPVLTLHEPDGELESAHALREIIKSKKYDLEPMTHVLLFTAARNELWRKLAEPILSEGGYVFSARNWWSTLAYQGYGQGVSRSKIIRLTREMMPERYLKPDLGIVLTLPDTERLKRETGRDDLSSSDTFESKPAEFQDKVNHAYLKIADEFGLVKIDASPSREEIQKEILKLI